MRSMRSMGQIAQAVPQTKPPEDRLNLTTEQLNEIISRDLRVEDPQAPKHLVRMNFKTHAYEEASNVEAIAVHVRVLGRLGVAVLAEPDLVEPNGEEEDQKEEGVLRNQFNFSDRATQGKKIRRADVGTLTEAPIPKDCFGSTSQYEIADFYAKDKQIELVPPLLTPAAVTRVMERVVNQNMDPNISVDFKYYDDQRDSLNPKQGYILPLWTFKHEILSGCNITMLEWNPVVNDIFAVSYGTPLIDKSGSYKGFLATWTLKNPSNPRNIIEMETPVTCLSWNHFQPSMIACGCANGNILIYDVRSRNQNAILTTAKLVDRHTLSVTYLRWLPMDSSGNFQILSASLDGKILSWTLVQNEMKFTEICRLPAGIIYIRYFSDASTHMTVACDDGQIFTCLRTRTTEPPVAFHAHTPPILSLSQNKFHPHVYATTGADWSLKIWRIGQTVPIHRYDFAPHIINSVSFATHSSTILAAVSSDGILRLYELNVDKYKPICQAEIVESYEGALTFLSWHPRWPLALIGDERGIVHSVKISPNLRKNTKIAKEEEANRLANSSSNKGGSRGILPEGGEKDDDDDDGGKGGGEEAAAALEAFKKDECDKFEKCMGVLWLPDVASEE